MVWRCCFAAKPCSVGCVSVDLEGKCEASYRGKLSKWRNVLVDDITGRLGQDEFDPGFVNPADIIEARSQTADKVDAMAEAVPISFEVGLGELGMQWLSSTTRHCHIFVGKMDDEGQWDQSQLDHLTIEVDPEDEFVWTDDSLEKVYRRFDELVEQYSGSVLDEYVLRLMGSEVEHFIRGQLLRGEIKYNVNVFNMNYSMGRPRLEVCFEEPAAMYTCST